MAKCKLSRGRRTNGFPRGVAALAVTLAMALAATNAQQDPPQAESSRDVDGHAGASAHPLEYFGGYGWPQLPSAERNLHLNELEEILLNSQRLVDGNGGHEVLHRLHHIYAIPALLAVAHDDEQPAQVRLLVVQSLATYPPEYVAPDLVTLLQDPDEQVAATAHQALYYISGRSTASKSFEMPKNVEARESVVRSWQERWRERLRSLRHSAGGYGSGGGYGHPPSDLQRPRNTASESNLGTHPSQNGGY